MAASASNSWPGASGSGADADDASIRALLLLTKRSNSSSESSDGIKVSCVGGEGCPKETRASVSLLLSAELSSMLAIFFSRDVAANFGSK